MPTTLDSLRASLRKGGSNAAWYAAAVEQATKLAADAAERSRHASAALQSNPLASATDRAKARDAAAAAYLEAEDADAILAEAQRQHAEAIAASEDARRVALYKAGQEASAAAAEALAKQYPRLCREMLGILGQLACAQRTVALANAELPAGAEPIADPEHVARGNPGLPREIVSDEEVELWGRVDQAVPVEEAFQSSIYDVGAGWGRRKGYDAGSASLGEPQANYRLRVFRKITYREAEAGQYPMPLAAALQLPALRGDRMTWGESFPVGFNPALSRAVMGAGEPDAVIAELARIEADAVARPVKIERPLKVEWASFRDVVPLPLEAPSVPVVKPIAPRPTKFGASPFAPSRAAGGRR